MGTIEAPMNGDIEIYTKNKNVSYEEKMLLLQDYFTNKYEELGTIPEEEECDSSVQTTYPQPVSSNIYEVPVSVPTIKINGFPPDNNDDDINNTTVSNADVTIYGSSSSLYRSSSISRLFCNYPQHHNTLHRPSISLSSLLLIEPHTTPSRLIPLSSTHSLAGTSLNLSQFLSNPNHTISYTKSSLSLSSPRSVSSQFNLGSAACLNLLQKIRSQHRSNPLIQIAKNRLHARPSLKIPVRPPPPIQSKLTRSTTKAKVIPKLISNRQVNL